MIISLFLSNLTNKLQTKYTKPNTLTKTQRYIIESGKQIQTTQPVIEQFINILSQMLMKKTKKTTKISKIT